MKLNTSPPPCRWREFENRQLAKFRSPLHRYVGGGRECNGHALPLAPLKNVFRIRLNYLSSTVRGWWPCGCVGGCPRVRACGGGLRGKYKTKTRPPIIYDRRRRGPGNFARPPLKTALPDRESVNYENAPGELRYCATFRRAHVNRPRWRRRW